MTLKKGHKKGGQALQTSTEYT